MYSDFMLKIDELIKKERKAAHLTQEHLPRYQESVSTPSATLNKVRIKSYSIKWINPFYVRYRSRTNQKSG